MSTSKAREWMETIELSPVEQQVARLILREISERLSFLEPICVARRMRCASPPDSVDAVRAIDR